MSMHQLHKEPNRARREEGFNKAMCVKWSELAEVPA